MDHLVLRGKGRVCGGLRAGEEMLGRVAARERKRVMRGGIVVGVSEEGGMGVRERGRGVDGEVIVAWVGGAGGIWGEGVCLRGWEVPRFRELQGWELCGSERMQGLVT